MRVQVKTLSHPRGIAKVESIKEIELQLDSSREFLLNHIWWAANNDRVVHIAKARY